jgi:hypothetical protein
MFVVVRRWTSKSGCGLLISVFKTFELGKTYLRGKKKRELIDSPHSRLVVVPHKKGRGKKTVYSCSTVASLAVELKNTEN